MESRLLHPGFGEQNRQNLIHNWLHKKVGDVVAGWRTSAGLADLYLTNRRIIIEVKKGGRLKDGPHKLGTGSQNESAFNQVERYILAERERERLYPEDDITDHPWLGIITDAVRWWVWEWPPASRGDSFQKNHAWQGTTLTKYNIEHLANLFDRTVGKDWAPADPSYLFEDTLKRLRDTYEREKDVPATITQKGLWLQQLRASGNAPVSDIDEIFIRHTLLILITRLIARTIHSTNNVTAGFVQWVREDDIVFESLVGIIHRHDWRRRSTDILRSLYEHYIPSAHRRSFGEYYTPDWLAEKICMDIIDDAYIEEQIANFRRGETVMGVLDPCCGSGTFLVHTINRIIQSEAMSKSMLSEHQKTDFLTEMIHGIDIHPVAVEMARVNVLRLLPTADPCSINIYQGDSMLISRSEGSILSVGGENMFLKSPGGRDLVIPKNFLKSNDNIRVFVESAKGGIELPRGIGDELTDDEKEMVREAHHSMTEIIRNEQNGVWYWYIVNQAAPILLSEKKVGRIVSNPPWVALQEIQDATRKSEILRIAKDKGLFVGGTVAGKFDIAMLAVHRAMNLYLMGEKAGWVLPQGAMLGAGNWEKLTKRYEGRIMEMWDLGRLPFHNTPTCVVLAGRSDTPVRKTYRMSEGVKRVRSLESWNDVERKVRVVNRLVFPKRASYYTGRHGASLQPMCLVRVETQQTEGDNIRFTTYATFKQPWKKLGSRSGVVPASFVRNTLIRSGMFPFYVSLGSNIIPILNTGEWDPARNDNKYWKTAQSLYARNRGLGKNTPKTLENCLDHMRKLSKQMGIKNCRVSYNSSGDYLYAAVIPKDVVCGVGVVSVETAGLDEARFLVALLNASCLHDAFVAARKTDRDFHLHILKSVPLPRFDAANKIHQIICKTSQKCEKIAQETYTMHPEYGDFKMRATIRSTLQKAGLQHELRAAITKILPDYIGPG